MFANSFTILADAFTLVPALNRNLLLSLAEDDFFRVRWSVRILDETERGIAKVCAARGLLDGAERAKKARLNMQIAFEDAIVAGYESLVSGLGDLPDSNDAHVIAAAVKTRASIIVTDNSKHFPEGILGPLDLEAKTLDSFVADTIGLDTGRAVASVRKMRERLKRPEKTPEILLLDMEARGLTQTVDALRGHLLSL
jgi:predicted nucleic acid-binding protein